MVSGSRLRNPNIKRALLFHNVLSQELRMNNETPVSRRRANDKSCHGKLALSGKVLRKYRLLHSVRQFGVSYKSMSERQTTEKKKTYVPQTVRLGPHQSSSLSLSTGAPQGCVLSPLLYSANYLFTLLPSGRRYRATTARTSRLQNSFIPRAITVVAQTNFVVYPMHNDK